LKYIPFSKKEEVGAHGPTAQGSVWIAGDALLEVEQ